MYLLISRMIEIVGFEQNVVILVVVTVSNLTTINDAIIRYKNVEYSIDTYLIDIYFKLSLILKTNLHSGKCILKNRHYQ